MHCGCKLACMDTRRAAISTLVLRIARECAYLRVCYNMQHLNGRLSYVGNEPGGMLCRVSEQIFCWKQSSSLLNYPKNPRVSCLSLSTLMPRGQYALPSFSALLRTFSVSCIGDCRHYIHAVGFESAVQLFKRFKAIPTDIKLCMYE